MFIAGGCTVLHCVPSQCMMFNSSPHLVTPASPIAQISLADMIATSSVWIEEAPCTLGLVTGRQ
jgi:hypothetical protein